MLSVGQAAVAVLHDVFDAWLRQRSLGADKVFAGMEW